MRIEVNDGTRYCPTVPTVGCDTTYIVSIDLLDRIWAPFDMVKWGEPQGRGWPQSFTVHPLLNRLEGFSRRWRARRREVISRCRYAWSVLRNGFDEEWR